MSITPHQAKYFAYELTKQNASNTIDKFASTLADAQVDLNPHQIDAALFAFRSPLSKGALLADEVGLGKTIEAGILLAQKWAERKRRLLVIAPATLRKQWSQELSEKFFFPSTILEKKSFDQQISSGNLNPFNQASIVICSYQFVKSKDAYIKQVPWDLVIIDEAHRLRNVYKPTNKVGNAIKNAIAHSPKVLLTATPLQNSLLELYGLISIIDEHTFGDLKSFKQQFVGTQDTEDFQALKNRLATVCQRTLRRQVLEYIRYTNRIPITQEFFPSESEQKLYDLVSDYLQKDNLYALPNSQRKLMTLILRKLLASSTFALSGTLTALSQRLKDLIKIQKINSTPIDLSLVATNLEITEEIEEEWDEDEDDANTEEVEDLTPAQIEEVKNELRLLEEASALALSIVKNSKGEVLLQALKKGFEKLKELGAAQKAVIFTESTRTQNYLQLLLESSPAYAGKIVLFNGSNTDPRSKEIYKAWMSKNQGTDKLTGSPSADMRAALVEYFKNEAVILIATEAAAEGINLQFCSLVANFDLPWNPQRIEQRIGRCHRYGQKHDVVVVNFLNKANAADQRVFELLDQKFKLFDGVFGASDEVLGALESGLDFEKKISEIYQKCRSPQQIEFEFNALQKKMEEDISNRMLDTKQKLLENFDEDVQEKLRVGKIRAEETLSKHDMWLWQITRFYLKDYAEFEGEKNHFILNKNPFANETIYSGPYRTGKNVQDANLYRVGHPLAQKVIFACKELPTPNTKLSFQLSSTGRNLSGLDGIKNESGSLSAFHVQINSFETEDFVLLFATDSRGNEIDQELITKLMTVPSVATNQSKSTSNVTFNNLVDDRIKKILDTINTRNGEYFDDEVAKLDLWAEDKRSSLKTTLKEMDDETKELKKAVRNASNLPEKLDLQKKTRFLEKKRDEAWKEYDSSSKKINEKKDNLIDELELKLGQTINKTHLFSVKWEIV